MTTAEARIAPFHLGARFSPNHKWDRNAFLFLVGLIWLGVLMGFVPDILKHLRTGLPFPFIVHVHAALFVGWLLLLTGQVLLIRARRTNVHRKLGLVGMAMAPLMVVAGVAASIIVEKTNFGTPLSRPPFLAIEFTDMLAFAGLSGAALILRGDTSAHKRLILLATFYIADAGYSRWLGPSIVHLLGRDSAGVFSALYLGTDLLLLTLGGYDLVTRKRLHPAFVAGSLWILACQFGGVSLYRLPEWKPVALAIIGH
jgi:uncharacterized membrane protein